MKILAFTHNGLQYDHNEDSYLVNGACRYMEKLNGEADIYSAAVFDGVGGANAGEVASVLASKLAAKNIKPQLSDEALKQVLADVNAAIVNEAQTHPTQAGMACTVAGVLFRRENTVIYNIGDSKVFKIKNGIMMQLTLDDTYAAFMARTYGTRYVPAENDHRIVAYLGNPEYSDEQPHINVISALGRDELYFLCTDGVTDYIDADELEEILTDPTMPLEEKSRNISRAVLENGARDNFTFIMLKN